MNYSRSQQFKLLENLGVDAPTLHDLAYALIGLLCAVSLAGAGWALWDRHRQDPWQRLQRQIRPCQCASRMPERLLNEKPCPARLQMADC